MTKVIRVDDYTYELIDKIVKSGKASTFTDAINKALASYAGIRYQSKEERRIIKEYARTIQLGKMAIKEE